MFIKQGVEQPSGSRAMRFPGIHKPRSSGLLCRYTAFRNVSGPSVQKYEEHTLAFTTNNSDER